jgi:hypothetical protein
MGLPVRPNRMSKDNIKWGLKEKQTQNVNRIRLVQDEGLTAAHVKAFLKLGIP